MFGTATSGNSVGPSVIAGRLTGPALWNGGKFGPEASVVVWLVVIAASGCLLWRMRKAKRTEPPIWGGGLPLSPSRTGPDRPV